MVDLVFHLQHNHFLQSEKTYNTSIGYGFK
jgi:hypothetical protein